MSVTQKIVSSPVGKLTLIADESALVGIRWEREMDPSVTEQATHPILQETQKQLAEYFAGERTEFDIPLRADGTSFQKRVWQGLREIPYGALWSYGQLARHIGQAGAARAVGSANGRNPIPIIVPCHRVIGSDGTLTGFGGGLDVKEKLIAIERSDKQYKSPHLLRESRLHSPQARGIVCAGLW